MSWQADLNEAVGRIEKKAAPLEKPIHSAVEGGIGAGKTVYHAAKSGYHRAKGLKEGVEKWTREQHEKNERRRRATDEAEAGHAFASDSDWQMFRARKKAQKQARFEKEYGSMSGHGGESKATKRKPARTASVDDYSAFIGSSTGRRSSGGTDFNSILGSGSSKSGFSDYLGTSSKRKKGRKTSNSWNNVGGMRIL